MNVVEVGDDASLVSSPTRRRAPPAMLSPGLGTPVKKLVDYSDVSLSKAEGASGKALQEMMKARPRPGDIDAWFNSLKNNEAEKAMLERALVSFGSIESLSMDQQHLEKENKKLRFREQRFSQMPLLRRRRLDMLPPALMKVMIVALQNELAAANSVIDTCRLAEHPLVVDKLPPPNKTLMQDLQKLLASGVAETTPFRASVADLKDRQRDLMLDALREQNRSLRSQIMRLQACLQGMPGSRGAVMSGPEGSPRIANNMHNGIEKQGTQYAAGSPERTLSPNGSPKQQRFKLLEERLKQGTAEIARLQQELLKTQEDLRRSEGTILSQLEIEAKMIEEKARLSRQNFQLGTFIMRVLEDSHPNLAAQILKGRNLRGWFTVMKEGEDFDEEAWALERAGLRMHEEVEKKSVDDRSRSSSRAGANSDAGTASAHSGSNSREALLTPMQAEGKTSTSSSRPRSAVSSKRGSSQSRKSTGSKPGSSQRPRTAGRQRRQRGTSSGDRSRRSGGSQGKKPRRPKEAITPLQMSKLDPFGRRQSHSHKASISARSDKGNTAKPVFHPDDVPASARLLRLGTGPEDVKTPKVEDAPSQRQDPVIPPDVAEAITPVVMKFDRVLRQIFTHFARTQSKPIGSKNLFAEIARWTSNLTHASFYKVLKHYKVVPKLCTKKDAFNLLMGTNRELLYADFLARLVDIANISMKRLYVLADANSIAYLEKAFLALARNLNLLVAYEGGGKIVKEDEFGETTETFAPKRAQLMKAPPGVSISAATFVEYGQAKDRVLKSIFPKETLKGLLGSDRLSVDGQLKWADVKSYWWKNCSNSRTPGIIHSESNTELPPEFSNPATSPPRVVSSSRRRRQIIADKSAVANPANQARAFELLCNFMVQTEIAVGGEEE